MKFRYDDLFLGGYGIWQNADRFCFGTDAVLLYDFIAAGHTDAIDLCSGNGIVAFLLLAGKKVSHITTLELQKDAVMLAQKSAVDNKCRDRMDILQGDLRNIAKLLPAESFDAVCVNPPYFKKGSGLLPKEPSVAVSRYELECTLEDVLTAAAYLIRPDGMLYMVHRSQRQNEILSLLPQYGFSLRHLRRTYTTPERPGELFLFSACKSAEASDVQYSDITVLNEDGSLSDRYRHIYEKENV